VRGEAPRWNVSMMIMRPPQHGHGCESGVGSLASAPLVARASGFCRWHVEHAVRSGDVVGARGAGEQAVVTDAVEALRQDVDRGIPRGITAFLLFW
jgi:hypothetical protein